MAEEEKYTFRPTGIVHIGNELIRLEWTLSRPVNPVRLATSLEPFLFLEHVRSFEDIGKEAAGWHDWLLNQPTNRVVADTSVKQLRETRMRWQALIEERLQDLYLMTPETAVRPKQLMEGIKGMLPSECFSVLESLEISDLDEACRCILMGSPTAAEFMALRAAENLLRRWYESTTHKKIEHQTWGRVLDKLENEYPDEKMRPKEIEFLGYLKLRRDEVAHPDRLSSPLDADTTLLNVCSLIAGLQPMLVAK